MPEEERIRRAFRTLFYNLGKIREEIEEIKAWVEEIEHRMNNLFRIGDN